MSRLTATGSTAVAAFWSPCCSVIAFCSSALACSQAVSATVTSVTALSFRATASARCLSARPKRARASASTRAAFCTRWA
eukprot:4354182-Lingulodinium_polyedra.AAC.1